MKNLKHKFGATACERNSIKFPSKLERSCYDWLIGMKKRGKIRMFLRQIPFDLPGGSKHFVDFCIFTETDVLFVEAKGRDLPVGKLKRKQAEELYDVDIHVVTEPQQLEKLILAAEAC